MGGDAAAAVRGLGEGQRPLGYTHTQARRRRVAGGGGASEAGEDVMQVHVLEGGRELPLLRDVPARWVRRTRPHPGLPAVRALAAETARPLPFSATSTQPEGFWRAGRAGRAHSDASWWSKLIASELARATNCCIAKSSGSSAAAIASGRCVAWSERAAQRVSG